MIRPGRNDLCWCGSGLKYKRCHSNFDDKLESMRLMHAVVPSHKLIKTPEQVAKIKESAKINIAVLDYVAEHIKAGITTEEIDRWVYDVTTKMGGIPIRSSNIQSGRIRQQRAYWKEVLRFW